MAPARTDRAAVVLCGGLSSRMGKPKASLPFAGETLLGRVVRVCFEACGEVVVVAAEGQEVPALPAEVRVVRDGRKEQGPLEGIAAGLAAVRAPAAFCTPCDVPFLTPGFIGRMFDALGDAAAARAVVDGVAQPLLAVYRTSLAPKAARLVSEGRRRVIFLVEGEREAIVSDADASCFRDLDTPEDYRASLLRVELYGVARLRAGRAWVEIPAPATLGEALAGLAAAVPELVGPVIAVDGTLAAGSAASLDGGRFVSDPATPLPAGRPLLLLPASAGG
jgi:molybdopterin-guanine dinucleotide biosynthesis protein A